MRLPNRCACMVETRWSSCSGPSGALCRQFNNLLYRIEAKGYAREPRICGDKNTPRGWKKAAGMRSSCNRSYCSKFVAFLQYFPQTNTSRAGLEAPKTEPQRCGAAQYSAKCGLSCQTTKALDTWRMGSRSWAGAHGCCRTLTLRIIKPSTKQPTFRGCAEAEIVRLSA